MLANIPLEKQKKGMYHEISAIASGSIYKALCEWAENDDDIELIYDLYFSPESESDSLEDSEDESGSGFFEGLGRYFRGKSDSVIDDAAIGKEILYRKIKRMKEKMADPEQYYTFDLFEEFLFLILIEVMESRSYLEFDKLGSFTLSDSEIDSPEENEAFKINNSFHWKTMNQEEQAFSNKLQSQYAIPAEDADRLSRQCHRVQEMGLKDDEEDNLFFWDLDADFLFEDGFVSGIRHCTGPEGIHLGYGQESAEAIFRDIGLKPPIELLGTKEANRIRYENAAKRVTENDRIWIFDDNDLDSSGFTETDCP